MGGSGSGGNRPGGSGSGRPPMGGSGNGPPPAGRAAKPQLLRESFNAEVTVGKKSYDCQFNMIYTADKVDAKKSKARCKGIKKGAVKQVTVTSPNGFSFTMDMKFSAKGAAMSKITVEAGSSSGGSGGPSVTGPGSGGSGSGRPPTGSGSGRPPVGGSGSGRPPIGGSGSGIGGPPMGGIGSDMCFCVDEEMMNGPMGGNGGNGGGPPGSGPPGSGRPPTGGSGSGSGRPPVGGSGSGGSGSGSSGGSGSGGSGGATSGPGVTVPNVPNPGSDGGTFEITIVQSWSQETDYARVTQVQVPPTAAGQKVPMVIDLHGNE